MNLQIFKKVLFLGAIIISGMKLILVLGSLFPSITPSSESAERSPNKPNEFLSQADWTVKDKDSLKDSPPSQVTIETFVNSLLREDLNAGRLGDFQFVDLNRDGIYELVVSLDYTGRGLFNTLVLIMKVNDAFRTQTLTGWNFENISKILSDLNADGIQELLIPRPLADYEGAKCIALWTTIYVWNGRVYVDDSSSFPNFYQERLQNLERKIREGEVILSLSDELKEQILSCYYLEQDKMRRFLGIDPIAGFEQAVDWMKNSDVTLRRKAVRVFVDIKDNESLQNLRILMQDSDPSVAQSARNSLQVN